MEIEFHKITDFPRGTLYRLLVDAYGFNPQWQEHCDQDWREFDDFFYDNVEIADKYGFFTTLHGEPIGHISWNPTKLPEYVEIGHNCIGQKWKGNGYGKAQLHEALRRISQYDGEFVIRVGTNRNMVAPKNYESVGFVLKHTTKREGFTGDDLLYERGKLSEGE